MNFLVDAQLPRKLALWLAVEGHDAKHTLDLPEANSTADGVLTTVADSEQGIVVTKDADFVDSHLLSGQPKKLLLISTGNINNEDLQAIFAAHLNALEQVFVAHAFVELNQSGVILRD